MKGTPLPNLHFNFRNADDKSTTREGLCGANIEIVIDDFYPEPTALFNISDASHLRRRRPNVTFVAIHAIAARQRLTFCSSTFNCSSFESPEITGSFVFFARTILIMRAR